MNRASVDLKILITFTLIALTASLLPASAAAPYTPETLFLTVYADGNTVVEYTLTVDVTLPRAAIPIFGQLYMDMIVTGGQDILLDYTVKDGVATIDTLGAEEVNILYTALDLVNKEGAIWTLNIETPVTFSVRFPKEATIIGISSIPSSITLADNQYILTLNSGQQSVSYSTGVVGTKEQASISIKNAEIAVDQAESEGISVQEAEEELNKAQQAYDQGRYIDAEQSASKAMRLVEQALSQTTEAPPQPPQETLWIPWAVAALAVAALVIMQIRRRSGPKTAYEKEIRTIDVAKIFQSKPQLRLEDREAIQYLADSGGEAFEAELREHFNLPKTTIWRMVRRLQREDL
ncbi:MAG: hypothetical protein ACE5KU_04450, partial [Nitrososphaerales archaeon]